MLDPIERAEDAAERAYDSMTEAMPPGMFLCGCGHACSFANASTISPSPWAMPVCELCFDAWVRKAEAKLAAVRFFEQNPIKRLT